MEFIKIRIRWYEDKAERATGLLLPYIYL